MGARGAQHTHCGKEQGYYPERQPGFTQKVNPHGYRCEWCKDLIKWTYRAGELWKAPRFYCDNWICRRVYEHRSGGIESVTITLNERGRYVSY